MEKSIKVSLDCWEKTLLTDFQKTFLEDDGLPKPSSAADDELSKIFDNWCWVSKLREDLGERLKGNPRRLRLDSEAMWVLVCRWMSRWETGQACHSRLSQLHRDNPNLKAQLVQAKFDPCIAESADIISPDKDQQFWIIASRAMNCLRPAWRGLSDGESLPDRCRRYTIHNGSAADPRELLLTTMGLNIVLGGSSDPWVAAPEAELTTPAPNPHDQLNVGAEPVSDIKPLAERPGTMAHDGDGDGRIGGGSNDTAEASSSYSAFLETVQPMVIPHHQHQPMSHSRSDTKMARATLKAKLVTDNDAPTPDMALERLLRLLSSNPLPPHDELGSPTACAVDEAGPGSDDNSSISARSYRVFQVWSLTRMAAMECRRQIRHATEAEHEEIYLSFTFPTTWEDPGMWLEFIPFREMTYSGSVAPGSELLWNTERQLLLDHHLFTEEEVFKYCVENSFEFPGYKREDSVVFIASELSGIYGQLELESLWNDCAVTADPDNGTWYLLETIPGRKFRSIASEFGINAARAHFRRIVDQKRHGQTLQLADILQGTYKSANAEWLERYCGLVDVIDFADISLEGTTPLGGRNLDVYRATWACPGKIDISMSPKTFEVVLKRIWPPKQKTLESRSEQALFRELELSLLVSLKGTSCLSVLHGLTRMPSDHPLSKLSTDRKESVYLVIEYAKHGLEQYLHGTLKKSERPWDIITTRLEDLAASIETIHDMDIVHRDIHMENVMIREETYFHSPTVLSSDQMVIIDLGDSRTLETVSQSRNMYGNADFRAPEVKSKSGRYMSKASDMYAIGRVMAEVLEMGRDLIAKDSLVPAPLVHAAKACLRKDAKERDTAGELVKRLDMIGSAAFKLLESGHGVIHFAEAELVPIDGWSDGHEGEDEDDEDDDSDDSDGGNDTDDSNN